MFRQPAWAVDSYSSGPPAAGTVKTKSTGVFHQRDGSPCTPLLRFIRKAAPQRGSGDSALGKGSEWPRMSALAYRHARMPLNLRALVNQPFQQMESQLLVHKVWVDLDFEFSSSPDITLTEGAIFRDIRMKAKSGEQDEAKEPMASYNTRGRQTVNDNKT